MIAQHLYSQLILNLETAKGIPNPLPPKIKTTLQSIGSFLRNRSSEFEVLENQEDVTVFLSVCKSNTENLVLVFHYFLSDSPVMENKKESSSEFLKTLLNNFDKAIKVYKNTGDKTISKSEFRVSNGNNILEGKSTDRKMPGGS